MLSGLTPKALRLYDERGILKPVVVDPVSGYRRYSSEQIRHGQTLWALREGGVPLAELGDVDAFDVEGFQERLRVKRMLEDAALRLALAYRSISVADWPVDVTAAAPLPWVGTCVDITLDDDVDPQTAVFALPVTFERHRTALRAALEAGGAAVDVPWWTTAGRGGTGDVRGARMVVCAPAARDLRADDWDGFTTGLRAALGDVALTVVGGVLPARLEVSVTAHVDGGDERASMAAGLAPRLAIDARIRDRAYRPLAPHTRELHDGPIGTTPVTTVRDVALPAPS